MISIIDEHIFYRSITHLHIVICVSYPYKSCNLQMCMQLYLLCMSLHRSRVQVDTFEQIVVHVQ